MPISRREFVASTGAMLAFGPCLSARALTARHAAANFEWKQLRGGVRAEDTGSYGGNVLLWQGKDSTLIVDAKFAWAGSLLRGDAEALGSDDLILINTHHHGDHTGGNIAFREGPDIIAHRNAIPRIKDQFAKYMAQVRGGPRQAAPLGEEFLRAAQEVAAAADTLNPEAWEPTKQMDAAHTVELGDAKVSLRHLGRAHTDNDIIVQLDDVNIIHTGDLVFHGLHSYFDPDGGVTCAGWIKAIKQLMTLCDKDTIVVPGHGAITDVSGVQAELDYLEGLWETVSRAVLDGMSKEETQALRPDFFDGLGFEQIAPRALGAVYDEITATP